MKHRFSLIGLLALMVASWAWAGKDPIGWRVTGVIPPVTFIYDYYGPVTYTFINNLPFRLTCPLYILPNINGEFNNYVDGCSGKSLAPGETCPVTFDFLPTSTGVKTIGLTLYYGRDIVPIPPIVTTTIPDVPPLVTGVVTQPLPTTMGAGEQKPFTFTYTNNTNGIVSQVSSNDPILTVNAGGGSIINIMNQCANLPQPSLLHPGESCTVSGTLQAGFAGDYTVSHTLSYFGNTTSLSTTTAASVYVIGSTDGFPTLTSAGEFNNITFYFTNNGTGTIYGVTTPSVVASGTETNGGPTPQIVSEDCSGNNIMLGDHCTVVVQFGSGLPTPPNYKLTMGFNYIGGSQVAQITAGPVSGAINVTNTVTIDLPASIGAGENHLVEFTFQNNGSGTAYNIVDPTTTFVTTNGTCATTSTTCFSTLASGANCAATCLFRANAQPTARVTQNFTYAAGVVPRSTQTATVNQTLSGSITTPNPVPTAIGVDTPLLITFTFENNGSLPVEGPINVVVNTGTNSTFTLAPGGDTCSPLVTFANGTSCTVTGTYEGFVTGDNFISATLTSSGIPVIVSADINIGRTFTITNNSTQTIWYSFSGAASQTPPGGCNTSSDCPAGSVCDTTGHICYWENPMPQAPADLELGIGVSATVIVPDKGTINDTIWQGSVGARTGCTASGCETADCVSGGTPPNVNPCPVGKTFAKPSTTLEFDLNKTSEDHYLIQGSYGFNMAASMGPSPTNAKQWQGTGDPYNCATPGDTGITKSYAACAWDPVPFLPDAPTTAPDHNANNYVWVKLGTDTSCNAQVDCGLETCGLRYDSTATPKFKRACGSFLGYWSPATACAIDHAAASDFFSCDDTITHPTGTLTNLYNCSPVSGTDLNNCYLSGATTNCCGCVNWREETPLGVAVPPITPGPTPACQNTNPEWVTFPSAEKVLYTLFWIKVTCPLVSAYPDDTGSSTFFCNTTVPSSQNTNITSYAITFFDITPI